ncbi:excinuclease ABC subunit UvrC [Candidatus Dojkabacteria bacterium]|nr:excinuclease ABC subunit UvrC [Candidatus Dojkabacteria bacterium]
MDKKLQQKIEQIQNKTGIYQFIDSREKILYVGKALRLRSRVKSYFTSNHTDRPWIQQMIPHIFDVKTIETENEIEALILEANLIKKYQPKYNASLKDNKRYAWIYIDTYSPFPRVRTTRDPGKSGRYFGPYPDGRPMKRMLKYLRKLYPFADCKLKFYPLRKPDEVKNNRICLYYHLGTCSGPCDNLITSQEYKKNIKNLIKTLEGKKKNQIRELEDKMAKYSKTQKFEKAAELRDKISDLRYLSQRIDIDFGDTESEFHKIRNIRYVEGLKEAVSKLSLNIPDEKLKKMRVECYDMSNLAGEVAYGSMTVSIGPNIENSQYRIFKIDIEGKADDTKMMNEVLRRRIKYLNSDNKESNESLLQKPDLILLDGAKSQLSAVKDIVPEGVGLLAISKGKRLKRAGKKQLDEFWTVKPSGKFVKLKFQNPFIFQLLRDEAHRFAIKHHRKGKRYLQTKSWLDEIPGVGPRRKKQLIKKFKTISKIKMASFEEINDVVNNKTVAESIANYNGKNLRSRSKKQVSSPR